MAGKSNDTRRKPNRNAKNAKLAPVKAIKVGVIDYKDVATLRKFISDRGKIRGLHQRGQIFFAKQDNLSWRSG